MKALKKIKMRISLVFLFLSTTNFSKSSKWPKKMNITERKIDKFDFFSV